MESGSQEGRMRPFTSETWNEFLPKGKSVISYIMEKDVPVYFQVDRLHHLVYRCHQHKLPSLEEAQESQVEDFLRGNETSEPKLSNAGLVQVEEFHDDLAFLRLDNSSLEQMAYSMSCPSPIFTRGGLAVARTYRAVGYDSRGLLIRELEKTNGVPDLVKVEFDEAAVIGRNAWNQARNAGGQLARLDPLAYALQGAVRQEELFLDAIDVARLKEGRYEEFEMVSYPFADRERMPGIYLMFQAAYRFNEQLPTETTPEIIKEWLTQVENQLFRGRDVFNTANLRTAEKFVRKKINRSQGGAAREAANLNEMWLPTGVKVDRTDYEYSYVGPSLSVILALADVWMNMTSANPGRPPIELAKMLMNNNFAGHEVGHLVYFIGGGKITLEENEELQTWAKDELGKDRRNVVDVGK